MRERARTIAGVLLLLGVGGCAGQPSGSILHVSLSASTAPASHGAVLPLKASEVPPPPGFVEFCQHFSDQCAEPDEPSRKVELTEETLQEIEVVNIAMNRTIHPQDDRPHYGVDEYWTIPLDGYGDCDDYVLVKRKALLNLGFPESALRIAEVFAPGFVRHVVLIVRTDKGNYVLDNLKDDIATWDHVPYGWLKWQDPQSSSGWASLK
jgi:predicted transglutaminase-like cysteine proteinase